jgi:hypothetical protein
MYRLSEIEDETLQRVVSNEMASGFLKTFGIKRATEHLEINEFRQGVIRYILNTYSENAGLHDLNDSVITEIGYKIEKMYDEILDPEYEYTFDEFGEYLLYIFIRHAYNNFYQAKESGYFDIDDNTLENYSGEPIFASSSLSIRDEIYLREMFGRFLDEDFADDPKMTGGDKDELVDDLIRAASIFAFMGYEDSDESFIFWDDDFLFYDEPGGADLFIDNKSGHGFVTGGDECEPISGSLKIKINT